MLTSCVTLEMFMSSTQHSISKDVPSDESLDDSLPPTPDEDGPHDVPDETVIEKTLPSVPVPEIGSGGFRD